MNHVLSMLHNLRSYPIAKSTRSSTAVQFSQLPAIIVVVFVPRRYEIGCLRYLLRDRKKEETVVASRSGERNELYHTAGISIGKRVPARKKTSTLTLVIPPPPPSSSCHLGCSTPSLSPTANRNDPRVFGA